ncbi:hypothetical protein [Salmonella enterica]|uniref:hypothetical protein n=1 Tax=Salmonella enterica TaxID=28901 RepID=UPI0034A1F8CB
MLDIYSSLSLIWRYSYCLVFQGATSMACIPNWPIKEFPDQFMCISRTRAVALIEELQKAIDYMNAGIERRSENLIQ